ncbi:MAG: cell division protein FtsL [Spirochaetaceae bacterium]|jgi:cell division protein FtsL|nr:cell division protein FtsL [Spirochaetaceae bacterium]GMO27440.1 MAG: hypothetical protein Pg6A_15010 [Termitinemataceae bacterium]
MKARILLYSIFISIPLAMGFAVWQSARYAALKREVQRNNRVQSEIVAQNRTLITEIAALSASSRIGKLARDSLGLDRKKPEDVMHVSIRD